MNFAMYVSNMDLYQRISGSTKPETVIIGTVGVVEPLKLTGFSIADLAFSIYGAALSLSRGVVFVLKPGKLEKIELLG